MDYEDSEEEEAFNEAHEDSFGNEDDCFNIWSEASNLNLLRRGIDVENMKFSNNLKPFTMFNLYKARAEFDAKEPMRSYAVREMLKAFGAKVMHSKPQAYPWNTFSDENVYVDRGCQFDPLYIRFEANYRIR